MQLIVELPDQVARQWGETPDAVGRHVMEDAAIESYRAGRLSIGNLGRCWPYYWDGVPQRTRSAVKLLRR